MILFPYSLPKQIAGGGGTDETYSDADRISKGLKGGQLIIKAAPGTNPGPPVVFMLCYNRASALTAHTPYTIIHFDGTANLGPALGAALGAQAAASYFTIGVPNVATPAAKWGWFQLQGQCTMVVPNDTYIIGEAIVIDDSSNAIVGTDAVPADGTMETTFAIVAVAVAVAATSATVILVGGAKTPQA